MPAPRGRSKSAKKPSALELLKEDINKNQLQIDDLTNQIESVKHTLSCQVEEERRLRQKLQIILPEILAHRDREKFPLEPVNDVTDVDENYVREMVQLMIDDLRGRQSQKSLIELRIEELEQRVTEHNDNYQSIKRKNLVCMQGVNEALQCSSPHEVKFLLRRLKQDLLVEEPIKRPISAPPTDTSSRLFTLTQLPPSCQESPFGDPNLAFLKSMETGFIERARPIRKLSGETPVKYLLSDIREAITSELSIESSQRGDWRHFAHLVGISTETIQFWRRLELHNPMEQVLNFWKEQSSADITLLHRILMSPQVSAMNLAKLLSEFYYVD